MRTDAGLDAVSARGGDDAHQTWGEDLAAALGDTGDPAHLPHEDNPGERFKQVLPKLLRDSVEIIFSARLPLDPFHLTARIESRAVQGVAAADRGNTATKLAEQREKLVSDYEQSTWLGAPHGHRVIPGPGLNRDPTGLCNHDHPLVAKTRTAYLQIDRQGENHALINTAGYRLSLRTEEGNLLRW
jgi:hypothetical protein